MKTDTQITAVNIVEIMKNPQEDRSLMNTEIEGGQGGRKCGWWGHQKRCGISWNEIRDCGGSEQEVFEIQLGAGYSHLAVDSW